MDQLLRRVGECLSGPPNTIAVSTDYAHHGRYAAELTINAGPDGTQENTGLNLRGLPVQAYYSAWYYLPRTISVGTFWILFKFRLRTDAKDSATPRTSSTTSGW